MSLYKSQSATILSVWVCYELRTFGFNRCILKNGVCNLSRKDLEYCKRSSANDGCNEDDPKDRSCEAKEEPEPVSLT